MDSFAGTADADLETIQKSSLFIWQKNVALRHVQGNS